MHVIVSILVEPAVGGLWPRDEAAPAQADRTQREVGSRPAGEPHAAGALHGARGPLLQTRLRETEHHPEWARLATQPRGFLHIISVGVHS